MSHVDNMGIGKTNKAEFVPIGDEDYTNQVMMRQIQDYYHYNNSSGTLDVRTIDGRFAKNLYYWYLRKAKDQKQVEEMKKSVMLKELRSKFK